MFRHLDRSTRSLAAAPKGASCTLCLCWPFCMDVTACESTSDKSCAVLIVADELNFQRQCCLSQSPLNDLRVRSTPTHPPHMLTSMNLFVNTIKFTLRLNWLTSLWGPMWLTCEWYTKAIQRNDEEFQTNEKEFQTNDEKFNYSILKTSWLHWKINWAEEKQGKQSTSFNIFCAIRRNCLPYDLRSSHKGHTTNANHRSFKYRYLSTRITWKSYNFFRSGWSSNRPKSMAKKTRGN